MTDFSIPDFRNLVDDASKNKVRHIRGSTYLLNVNGEDIIQDLPTPPAQTTLGSLASLLLLSRGSHARAVLVAPAQVTLVMNDDHERLDVIQIAVDDGEKGMPLESVIGEDAPEQVAGEILDGLSVDHFTGYDTVDRWAHTLPLTTHPAFDVVAGLRKSQTFRHRDLIMLLRTTLAGFIDSETLNTLRAIQIEGSSNGVSRIGNGDAGLGRTVTQAARTNNGQSTIPDEITLTIPVYDLQELREERHAVRVVLEVDPNDGTPLFTLTAVHNDVIAAQEAALQGVVDTCEAHFPLVLRAELK